MLEKTLTNRILKRLKEKGFLAVKIAGGQYQTPGISDIVACSPGGLFVAIEVKQPGKQATALQKRFLQNVRDHHGCGICCDNFEHEADVIEYILEYEADKKTIGKYK